MDTKELEKEKLLTYFELCDYLQQKYGLAQGDYFLNENCSTQNPKIKKTSEGLFLHHKFEYLSHDLSKKENAKKLPYEYQKANNLVYCNYLEHYLLHLKITQEFLTVENAKKNGSVVGIGGCINFIGPKINDYFDGYQYTRESEIIAFQLIKSNLDDYVSLLANLYKLINENSDIKYIINHIDSSTKENSLHIWKGQVCDGKIIYLKLKTELLKYSYKI